MATLTLRRKPKASEPQASLKEQLAEGEAKLLDYEAEVAPARARLDECRAVRDEAVQRVAAVSFDGGDPAEAERERAHAEQELAAAEADHDDVVRRVEYGRKHVHGLREQIKDETLGSIRAAVRLCERLIGEKEAALASARAELARWQRRLDDETRGPPRREDIDHALRLVNSGFSLSQLRLEPRLHEAVEARFAAQARERERALDATREGVLAVEKPSGEPMYSLWRRRDA